VSSCVDFPGWMESLGTPTVGSVEQREVDTYQRMNPAVDSTTAVNPGGADGSTRGFNAPDHLAAGF
jgi:hypothetical protein